MRFPNRSLGLAALALVALPGCSAERLPTAPDSVRPPLVLAFSSDRPPSPPFSRDIYLYDVENATPSFMPPNIDSPNLDGPCALSGNGRILAFFSDRFFIGTQGTFFLYDVVTGELRLPAGINRFFNLQNPSISADGRFVAAQYQFSGAFSLLIALSDLAADTLIQVPNLNEPNATNFDPSLNGDGSLIAFAYDGVQTRGGYDIRLYSVPGDSLVPLPGLNSTSNDLSPAISADGRYVAFQSSRPGGMGIIDAYVYDRQTSSLLPLPGANTAFAEYSTVISPDGRYLAYVTDATGGGDLRLYDIRERRLVPIPGCNDPYFAELYPAISGR